MKQISLLFLLLCLTGCSGKANNPIKVLSTTKDSTSPIEVKKESDNILVEVNGKKLTDAQVDFETKNRFEAIKSQVPPEQISKIKNGIRKQVIQLFINKTLLLNEALKQNIQVEPEEESNAFKNIESRLPPGVTLSDVLKKSAIGEDKMREEVLIGIRIEKLLAQNMPEKINVSEKEISDFYKEHKERLSMPETVRARHILISTTPNDSDTVKEKKKKQAEELRTKILNGAKFEDIATKYSDGPSKVKGGDLGVFTRDKMVKSFSDAAFSQEVNAIGPVVETRFGYHIIQVTEHNKSGKIPDDELVRLVKNWKRQEAINQYIEKLKNQASIKYY